MDNINLKFETTLEKIAEYQDGDTRFIPVKIWLMHLGGNLNGSYFTKSVVENAIPSLYNTPILAYFEEDENGDIDTSDHRVVIEVKKDEIRTAYKGSAIGVIPNDCNPHFEMRKCEDDGVEREFLVVNGLIWRKWNEIDEVFTRDLIKAQSMELDEDCTYHFNKDGYCQFDSFKFFGACVLGEGVMPAMINSTVEVQFSTNVVMEEIKTKLEQYRNVFSTLISQEIDIDKSKEGGNFTLTNEMRDEILSEFDLSLDDIDFEITEDMEATEFRAKIEDFKCRGNEKKKYESETENDVEPVIEDVSITEDVVSDVENEISEEDKTEEVEQEEAKVDYCAEYEKLKLDYDAIIAEVESLRTFKANVEQIERANAESEIFAKFDTKLADCEDYNTLKENSSNYELSALTKECYAIYGMYMASIDTPEATEIVSTKFSVEMPKKDESPYGDLFKKYKN